MRIFATLKIAVRALKRNKMRTVLTMLGMIIGVGAVIAMVGIGNGAKVQVEAQIASLGQNVIRVFAGDFRRGGVAGGMGSAGTLTLEDALAVENEIPGILAMSPEIRSGGQIMAGENNANSQVLGESADYLTIRQWNIADGAMFSDADVRAGNKVCVLGKTTADKLFPDGEVVGQIIRIRNLPFKVLGVLERKGASMGGDDQDDVVVMPYSSAMKRFAGVNTLRALLISAVSADQLNSVQDGITQLLRQRHRIMPGREDDFIIRNQQEIADAVTSTTRVMTLLLAAIASVSLIVGGIGIMNIMLVSVTERTREIGIRMAVGARGPDIMLQFLIEAVTLSVLGGVIGIGAGIGTGKVIALNTGWAVATPPLWIVAAFLVSAAVGIFFGFYPARKASQLDPIDALRYE